MHFVGTLCLRAALFAALAAAAVCQTLQVAPQAPIGAPLEFTLATGRPSAPYYLDIGFHGTAPGLVLPFTGRVVPLNRPWSFLDVAMLGHGSTFSAFHGTTNGTGAATAILNVPAAPQLIGFAGHAVYLTLDLTSPDQVGAISPAQPFVFAAARPGWTTFAPSSDTRIVYISSTLGNDNNDGLSPQRAVRTVTRGKAIIRHGFPDWLLFRRGDTWQEPLGAWIKSGRSANERLLVGSYGPSTQRPRFDAGQNHGITITGGGGAPASIEHIAFVGLDFYAGARDPASPTYSGPGSTQRNGVQWLRPGRDVLFEDCAFRMFAYNIVVDAETSGLHDLTIRRCLVLDAYGQNGSYHSQGLYMNNAHGVVIEENLFDHNGWHDSVPNAVPTMFNHGMYIHWQNTGVVVRKNFIARGCSHGVQLRSGGQIVDNVFVRNGIALLLGGDYSPHPSNPTNLIDGNVILQGTDIAPGLPRGWAMEVKQVASPVIRNNIVSTCQGSMAIGAQLTNLTSATIVHNTLFQWNGGNLQQSASLPGFTIANNIVSQTNAFGSNVPWSTVPFTAPNCNLGTYHGLLGGGATIDAFVTAARQQSRLTWRDELTTAATRAYFRAAFKPTVNPGPTQVGAVPF